MNAPSIAHVLSRTTGSRYDSAFGGMSGSVSISKRTFPFLLTGLIGSASRRPTGLTVLAERSTCEAERRYACEGEPDPIPSNREGQRSHDKADARQWKRPSGMFRSHADDRAMRERDLPAVSRTPFSTKLRQHEWSLHG